MVTRNLVTDDGADPTGAADSSPALDSFNTWALTQNPAQIDLIIPAGDYKLASNVGYSGRWTTRVKNLHVLGAGSATTRFFTLNDTTFALGQAGTLGVYGDSGGQYFGAPPATPAHSARLQTVVAGSTQVTLIDSSLNTLWSIGDWACITGFDLQGTWGGDGYGAPSNPHWFEYVQITNIDAGTGVITFSAPLRYTYKSTWPMYDDGGVLGPDQGGPATLYQFNTAWDCTHVYEGFNYDIPFPMRAVGRDITFIDVTTADQNYPTQNNTWTLDACTVLGTSEADKLVDTMNIINGTTVSFNFQSSSIRLLNVSDCTMNMTGTPKDVVTNNATISVFRPGCWAYGHSETMTCTNTAFPTWLTPGGFQEKGPGEAGVQTYMTMNPPTGVITIPNGYGAIRWAVPGSYNAWVGQWDLENFRVIDVAQDASNTIITTTWTGGFPDPSMWPGGVLWLQTHPCPVVNFTNVTGNTYASDIAQQSFGTPVYSYSNQMLSGAGSDAFLWGNIVSIKVNVTRAYTGVAPELFLNMVLNLRAADGSPSYIYNAFFNLKTAGLRTINSDGDVTAGPLSGDVSLAFTPGGWLAANVGYSYADHSGGPVNINGEAPSVWPSLNVEIITDQGISEETTATQGRVFSSFSEYFVPMVKQLA